jgi:tetratricopeptide (TPR) repeat protein
LLAHFNQGLGHLYLREAKEMIACFRRVLEIDPDHAAGHYHLAVGLLEIGNVEDARAALDRAVELGHSPAPEFLKALERKDKSAGSCPENQISDGRSD